MFQFISWRIEDRAEGSLKMWFLLSCSLIQTCVYAFRLMLAVYQLCVWVGGGGCGYVPVSGQVLASVKCLPLLRSSFIASIYSGELSRWCCWEDSKKLVRLASECLCTDGGVFTAPFPEQRLMKHPLTLCLILIPPGEGQYHRGSDRAGLHQPEGRRRRFQPPRCHLLHTSRHSLHHTCAHSGHGCCKFITGIMSRDVSCECFLRPLWTADASFDKECW